ncbi:hypothetical protein BN946_scf184712.g8 [Trametes cinnabarina]|uniref:Anaphase-promoting complex subunit 4 WD40 domain-containing protein n=1 Tax=Pycnoporus cinnabarinus TaxID=5643 RepID=A0A060SVK7_PYCCI|nr:hypothetical protein BN946_scf184712.g8 [Trametes cinnabarina]
MRITEAFSLLYDCERVVRAFYSIIDTSFLQMYSTIALFAPIESPLRLHAAKAAQTAIDVRIGVETTWSAILASPIAGSRYIRALSFSPDGMYLACGDEYGSIQVLNAHTGAQRQILGLDYGSVSNISFSPTGKEILSSSNDNAVAIWDITTGGCIYACQERPLLAQSTAWSLNGALAAFHGDLDTVKILDFTCTEKVAVLQLAASVLHVVFAPDGDLLCGSVDGKCTIWDTKSINGDTMAVMKPTRTLKHASWVTALSVRPDNCLVACGLRSGEIVLWRKVDGHRVRSLPGESEVLSLTFYANGLLAAAYSSTSCVLWDLSMSAPVKILNNSSHVNADAIAFSSDGLYIAQSVGGSVQILQWGEEHAKEANTSTQIAVRLKRRLRRYTRNPLANPPTVDPFESDDPPKCLLLGTISSTTTPFVFAAYKNKLQLWDVSDGRFTRTIEHFSSDSKPSLCAALSPTGHLIVCTGPRSKIFVWETQTGQHLTTFAGHSSWINTIVFTHDEQHLLSASEDGTIRRWKIRANLSEKSSEVLFQSRGNGVHRLATSSSGQWMLSSMRRINATSPPNTSSSDLLAKPSRQAMKTNYGSYNWLQMHDETGRVVWVENHAHPVASVAFSEDCTRALAGNDKGDVFIYNISQLTSHNRTSSSSPPALVVPEYKLSSGGTRPVRNVSFSPDNMGIIAERSYTSIPLELRPSHKRSADPASMAVYYFDDEWLWRVDLDSDSRRLCYIPPSLWPDSLYDAVLASSWSSQPGHIVAYFTSEHRLVVIDASRC